MKSWMVVVLAVLVVGQAGVIAGLVRWGSPVTTQPAATPVVVSTPATAPPATAPALPDPGPTGAVPPTESAPAGSTPAAAVTPIPSAASAVEVTSEPSGARVSVDGVDQGVTPVTLTLEAGSRTIVVSDGKSTTTRTLELQPGGRVTMMAALAPAAPSVGWVTIASPLELQVISDANLLGTSKAARIMLPPGRHLLELVHPATMFQTTATVDIQAGRTIRRTIAIPNGEISLNAVPWAVVTLDGKELGTTPIANVTVPIGPHEVVWRHPVLGERQQTAMVTVKSPLRLVHDFTK
jgi:serine/threonine-protein kinase